MTQHDRWSEAQSYEREYWEFRDNQVRSGETADLSWYGWRANRLFEWLKRLDGDPRNQRTTILEIGNGPVGMISHFPGHVRIGVDPLERYFQGKKALLSARDPTVHYLEGKGEELPLADDFFDLVISDNCIDHVVRPGDVLAEIRRVMKPDGLLYMSVNTRNPVGYVIHRMLSRLRVDRGHPHSFTKTTFLSLLRSASFSAVDTNFASYANALHNEIRESPLRGIAKGVMGITEMRAEAIVTPSAPGSDGPASGRMWEGSWRTGTTRGMSRPPHASRADPITSVLRPV